MASARLGAPPGQATPGRCVRSGEEAEAGAGTLLRLGTQPSRLGQRPADLPKLPTKSEPSAAGASTVLRVSFKVFLSPFPPSHSRSPLSRRRLSRLARPWRDVDRERREGPRAAAERPAAGLHSGCTAGVTKALAARAPGRRVSASARRRSHKRLAAAIYQCHSGAQATYKNKCARLPVS